jgi:hypothetical protein
MDGDQSGRPEESQAWSRRRFLRVSLGAAVASAGAYGLIESLARKPERPAAGADLTLARSTSKLPREQYLFGDTATVTDNGVVVNVPPLYHQVVTAVLQVDETPAALQAAQASLAAVMSELENEGLLTFTPAGLGLAIGWGLSYFQRPALQAVAAAKLPLDVTVPGGRHARQPVLVESSQFATDPATLILEQNDVVFVMASDSLANIATASNAIFEGSAADLFTVTSTRKGFVDATALGSDGTSLTKQFAVANNVPGAASIPDQAQLFLGFTSTQQAAMGPGPIANFESLGMTNQKSASYFGHGTTLALSHLYEDLESWYANNTYAQRVGLAFRPDIMSSTPNGTLTVPESPVDLETPQQVGQDIAQYGVVGHSASMQPVSRLARKTRGFAAGSAIPVRADFNTIDNPFTYSSDPTADNWSSTPAAGVHFLAYVPTGIYFQRLRQAMDGQTPQSEPSPPFEQFVHAAAISASHRQNFLIPPRSHRSFPLAELL